MAPHPRKPRPTLKDVARELGLSARTVSRVMNDEPRISPRTRKRVLAKVEALGFRPNRMARNMRVGSRDAAVGLVIPDLANPFFGTVASGVEKVIRTRGLNLVIASSDEDPVRERAVVTALLERQVAALLLVPPAGSDHGYLRVERRHGLPIVSLDRPLAGLTSDGVLSANFEGAVRAVGHLARHGHRRIGFLGDVPDTLYTRRERYRGYLHALADAAIDVDLGLVERGHHEADAAEATMRLLARPRPPTAIFAANNLACIGVLIALTRARRREVALVGFDDFTLADAFEPGITVVAQDPETMGTRAAELVLARLDGDRSAARTVTLPNELVARGSGELGPVDRRRSAR